jgi:hypothetical protein
MPILWIRLATDYRRTVSEAALMQKIEHPHKQRIPALRAERFETDVVATIIWFSTLV